MTGSARIVVIVAGILACVAFAHYMRVGTTVAPAPAAVPKVAVVAVPVPRPAPAAKVDDVPPWLRTDLAPAPAETTAPAAIVPAPQVQAATILADPRRAPAFQAAGVDMEAIRNNQRIASEMRPLLADLRRLAADQTNPENRKALVERLAQVRALQAGMVYDVRLGAHR